MSSPSLPARVSPWIREFVAGCAILVAVVASRHATFDFPIELSGDESELLVQAARYSHDLIPWRAVDGSTIGPVNPWFLLLLHQSGWPLTYAGIHFLGAVLLGGIAVVSYFAVRLLLPFGAAGFVGLLGGLALGGSASINFMYFATELVPALLLSLAVLGLLAAGPRRPGPAGSLVLAALCSGLAPWAKLQAAPMALLLVGFAVGIAWKIDAGDRPARRPTTRVLLVLAGAVFPTIVILAAVWLGRVFPDFWASYVVANIGYAGNFTPTDAAGRFVDLLRFSQLNGLIAAAGILGFASLLRFRKATSGRARPGWAGALAALYLAATLYACIRPPHGFGHYHIFLINPLLLALGALLRPAGLVRPEENPRHRRASDWAIASGALLAVGVFATYHQAGGEPLREHLAGMRRDASRLLPATVGRAIRSLAPEARSLVVWGWMPSLYLESGVPSATRQTISHFLIDEGPSRDFLRRQFLGDVRSAAPDVIVDAVASDCYTWYWPVKTSGIESFPEFADYIRTHYDLRLQVTGDQAGVPLRIFIRRPASETKP